MLIKNTTEDIKLPYKKYLDALVLSGLQVSEISTKLREDNLSPFPKNLPKTVESILNSYNIDYRMDVNEYPEDIRLMVHHLQRVPGSNVIEIKQAFEMLRDPSIKRWLNAMVMAGISPDLSYVLVSTKTDKLYEELAYFYYCSYFFNLSECTVKDKTLIASEETDADLKAYYKIAMEHNKEKMLWKLGFTPDMSVDEIVKIVAVDSVMRFKETADDFKAARLGALVLKAVDKLKELDAEKKRGLESSAGFEISLLRQVPNVKSIQDLDETLEGEEEYE